MPLYLYFSLMFFIFSRGKSLFEDDADVKQFPADNASFIAGRSNLLVVYPNLVANLVQNFIKVLCFTNLAFYD
jgi:hypothetical protein